MANYIGVHCPVCSKRFAEGDDIVVCPVCGAPHHRVCYQQTGHCALNDLHIEGYSWQPPSDTHDKQNKQDSEHSAGGNICPSCGANNPKEGIFCQVCGALLGRHSEGGTSPFGFNPFGQDSRAQPRTRSAYSAAFGGLSPDEEIDGVSARDIALYIGENSQYFLPRFKQFSQHSGFVVNWSALLFNFLYFFYRKMYFVGAMMLLFLALTQIPTLFIFKEYSLFVLENFDDISIGIVPVFTPHEHLWAYSLIPYMRYLLLAESVLFGAFANRIYKIHVLSNIRKIKKGLVDAGGLLDDKIYTESLVRRGRTSRAAVAGAIIGVSAVYFGVAFSVVISIM